MVRLVCGLLAVLLAALACADRVGIVVQYDDSVYETACVDFSGDATAEDALGMAFGLDIYDDPTYGAGLCGINGIGCGADDCWCDSSKYWGFYYKGSGGWRYSGVGIGYLDDGDYRIVQDGGVIGFRWGAYGSGIADKSFDEICVAPGTLVARPAEQGEERVRRLVLTPDRNESCGEIVFSVATDEGRVVPFARVRIVERGGLLAYGEVNEALSDGDGKARFTLVPGIYFAQAIMPQYVPYEKEIEVYGCDAGEGAAVVAPANGDDAGQLQEDVVEFINGVAAISLQFDEFGLGWENTGWAGTGWGEGWIRR